MIFFHAATATNLVAFGELNFRNNIYTDVLFYVNSPVNNTLSVCHLYGCTNCTAPVEISMNTTVTLSGGNIYTVRRDELTASVMINDSKSQSQDYSLVLMLDQQANHSFVYYAASIDFVGDYLQSMHSNDESFFAVTALADDIVLRISPSQTVYITDVIVCNNVIIRIMPRYSRYQTANISDVMIAYGEEYKMTLDLGETLMISSSEDLTGFKITANKAISVYSGHYCASGKSTNCSILSEQIPPYNSWGNSFVLHTNISGLSGNMFKVIASDAGANITMNCTTEGDNYKISNYNLGFRQHAIISIIYDYCIVDSDKNILVIQFKDCDQLVKDTFMTIVPAVDHFQTQYVFNTYTTFDNYVVLSVKNTDPDSNSLLLNKTPVAVEWKSVDIDENTYYIGTLSLSANRHTIEFSRDDIKFGAVVYGIGENHIDTYALPAGLALGVKENLPIQGMYVDDSLLLSMHDVLLSSFISSRCINNTG